MTTLSNLTKDTDYQKDLVNRLRIRASIRRLAKDRKSVINGQQDRLTELLEEAADAIENHGLFSMTQEDFESDKYA